MLAGFAWDESQQRGKESDRGVPRCRVEAPELRPIGDAHVVACHEAERVLASDRVAA